MGMAKKLRKPW